MEIILMRSLISASWTERTWESSQFPSQQEESFLYEQQFHLECRDQRSFHEVYLSFDRTQEVCKWGMRDHVHFFQLNEPSIRSMLQHLIHEITIVIARGWLSNDNSVMGSHSSRKGDKKDKPSIRKNINIIEESNRSRRERIINMSSSSDKN